MAERRAAGVDGKAEARRVAAHEAQLHQERTVHERRIRTLRAQTRTVDAKAVVLIMKDAANEWGQGLIAR